MKKIKRKIIKIYQKSNGDTPFIDWLESLDKMTKYRIQSRLARVTIGNLGDYKILGDGINELKFSFGSGYRIYFSDLGDCIIILLCAGNKSTQTKDIKLAKHYFKDYLSEKNNDQKH